MGHGVRRYYMEEDFIEKKLSTSRPVKSLMWYVGWLISLGVAGMSIALFLMEVVFVK